MKEHKFDTLKAWCSGKAYNKPNRFEINCCYRSLRLYIGDIFLASFYYYTKKDFNKAIKIALEL